MTQFDKTVPFDPGYSPLAYYFGEQASFFIQAFSQIKNPNQKKFQLMKVENSLVSLINKSSAFYLGCILWGGFISQRFKAEPKEITGNTTEKLSEEAIKDLDSAYEARAILEFIENFDRDCRYFLKHPAKVPPFTVDVLNAYIEFAKLNNNFVGVKKTSDVKIPEAIKHFEKLSLAQLDELCDKIFTVIESGKIEGLWEIGFFN